MEKILTESGIVILKNLHDKNEKETMDDLEYIPIIKTVINSFTEYATSIELSSESISKLHKELTTYAENLYLNSWMKNAAEEENEKDVKFEGMEYFKYVYKHEEYPD
jgi:hypothetical protein